MRAILHLLEVSPKPKFENCNSHLYFGAFNIGKDLVFSLSTIFKLKTAAAIFLGFGNNAGVIPKFIHCLCSLLKHKTYKDTLSQKSL